MARPTRLTPLAAVALALLAAPGPVRGDEPVRPRPAVRADDLDRFSAAVGRAVTRARDLARRTPNWRLAEDGVRLADQLTWEADPAVRAGGGAVARKPVLLFAVAGVEASGGGANKVPFTDWELPGSGVRTSVRVDCEVRAEYDPAGTVLRPVPGRPQAADLIVPGFVRLEADFPPDAVAAYDAEYASYPRKWLGGAERARAIRDGLYAAAKEQAVRRVEEYLAEQRAATAGRMRADILRDSPDLGVEVRESAAGYAFRLDGFLPPAAPEPGPSGDRPGEPAGGGADAAVVAAAGVVFAAGLWWGVRRSGRPAKGRA